MALVRKEKNYVFCMNWEIKCSGGGGGGGGVWVHFESLNGLSWGTGGKTLEKCKIFILKLV